jgi:hypothetical protein
MVFGRPLEEAWRHEGGGEACRRVTTVQDEALRQLLPAGRAVEVVVLARVTDFFLGLNAGQWLKIRLAQVADGGLAFLAKQRHPPPPHERRHTAPGDDRCDDEYRALLEGTGLQLVDEVEAPPADESHLHHFYGNFGGAGGDWEQLISTAAAAGQQRGGGDNRLVKTIDRYS